MSTSTAHTVNNFTQIARVKSTANGMEGGQMIQTEIFFLLSIEKRHSSRLPKQQNGEQCEHETETSSAYTKLFEMLMI